LVPSIFEAVRSFNRLNTASGSFTMFPPPNNELKQYINIRHEYFSIHPT
jgi:hypothetical protein